MRKKCKIYRLPTENQDDFQVGALCQSSSIEDNLTVVNEATYRTFKNVTNNGWIPQYLYVTVDDEICVGDWVYSVQLHEIRLVDEYDLSDDHKSYKRFQLKKIVSSTNPTLNMPKPSDSFIKKYCSQRGINVGELNYAPYNSRTGKKYEYFMDVSDDASYGIEPIYKLDVLNSNVIEIFDLKLHWSKEDLQFIKTKISNILVDHNKFNKLQDNSLDNLNELYRWCETYL